MHPLFLLAFVTFVLVVGFLVWNRMSTKRHKAPGVGGVNDPLSGATDELRDPDEMRASLDHAASQPMSERQQVKS
jgi:hypothetical protein